VKGENDDDDDGREARGQTSWSPVTVGGALVRVVVVAVGGTGLPDQDQPVENGAGAGASHSDSAWNDIASRRCLRMRPAANARAAEGKGKVVVVCGDSEEDSEDSEEKELLEDIVYWRVVRGELNEESEVNVVSHF
jgi:hypothetical protein